MARYIDANCFNYYVIRNKETGQYYRGKGENKWGDYYNRASIFRYKTYVSQTLEDLTRRGYSVEAEEISITPVAADTKKEIDQDALPKALDTIESLKKSHKETRRKMRNKFAEECGSHYNHGKFDAAREIFEEIENNYADFLFDGYRNIIVLTEKDYNELKKKYTE